MSGDTLVFDMSSQSEGSPSVFVRKDWLSILDNQNQNYQGNQSVIDTSQLANSNKYMNYREAYFLLPMIMTLTGSATAGGDRFTPATAATSCDMLLGLKNWYGSIIHSFTLDYNGTTIIQQTPYVGLWNTFKLITSLSYDDLITQSAQLGFYPDSPLAWTYELGAGGASGLGTCNNVNGGSFAPVAGQFSTGAAFNSGLLQRQLSWAYDPDGSTGPDLNAATFGQLLPSASCNQLWKSYINGKSNQTAAAGAGAGSTGGFQVSISAIVYLKHIASFFERVPLLKGVFMKMTMNLNQSAVAFSSTSTFIKGNITVAVAATGIATVAVIAAGVRIVAGDVFASAAGDVYVIMTQVGGTPQGLGTYTVNNNTVAAQQVCALLSATPIVAFQAVVPNSPLGGVQPIMIASALAGVPTGSPSGAVSLIAGSYTVSLAVGNKVLNSTNLTQIGTLGAASPAGGVVAAGPLSGSVILNVPAYTFNPVFESSYLSSPVKKIVYTDIYQYQIVNTIRPNQNFNNLISNGIANIKSVLVLPFFSAVAGNPWASSPLLSPFDPAGGGPTSPLCLFNQFNIQISGQNAIYNTERYAYEQFQNQLYGTNAVNAGQTDGMTSGLIDAKAFEHEYCYYYVNCGRMLPVEEAVPKSINILGLSMSTQAVDLFIFVEYGVEVSLDILTGARV